MLSKIDKLQVFSAFGTVQKIAIFEKNGGTQALIQYPGMNRGKSPYLLNYQIIMFSVELLLSFFIF